MLKLSAFVLALTVLAAEPTQQAACTCKCRSEVKGGLHTVCELTNDLETKVEVNVDTLKKHVKDIAVLKSDLEKAGSNTVAVVREEIVRIGNRVWGNLEDSTDGSPLDHLTDKMKEAVNGTLERSQLLARMQQMEEKDRQQTAAIEEILDNLRNLDQRVEFLTDSLAAEHKKLKILERQVEQTNSTIATVEGFIRENVSSSAENLKVYVDGLSEQSRRARTNLTIAMRSVEGTLSRLQQDLRDYENVSSAERRSIRSEMQQEVQNVTADIKMLQLTLGPCTDDPPSLRNGGPLSFERKPESVVDYHCDGSFVMTGESSVVCKSGKWQGRPPICSHFDAGLTLVLDNNSSNVVLSCYGDDPAQELEFSRVLDTGTGPGLPSNATVLRRGTAAVLDMRHVDRTKRGGAFQCERKAERGYAAVAAAMNEYEWRDANVVASPGEAVLLDPSWVSTSLPPRWRRNGVPVPKWDGGSFVEIRNARAADAGVYDYRYRAGDARALRVFRLVVRRCPRPDVYGESCDWTCPPCYSGGVCQDRLGVCVCPAGFRGGQCEHACAENRFGSRCEEVCPGSDCRGLLFCKPDPFGCACFPGFRGRGCYQPCDPGQYGADCAQPCHCADGPDSCNRFTGTCSGGCAPGWTGESCQIGVVG